MCTLCRCRCVPVVDSRSAPLQDGPGGMDLWLPCLDQAAGFGIPYNRLLAEAWLVFILCPFINFAEKIWNEVLAKRSIWADGVSPKPKGVTGL